MRRKGARLIPGERCPAERTGKRTDPAVTITNVTRWGLDGLRRCGKCGREDVRVHRSGGSAGGPMTAWYYDQHDVPVKP